MPQRKSLPGPVGSACDLCIVTYAALDDLPPAAHGLFGSTGIFATEIWFRACIEHAIPAGSTPLFVVVSRGDQPLAVFPLLESRGKSLASLTTPYSCLWQPLLAADLSARGLAGIAGAFARFCRTYPVTRLDALDPAEAFWPALHHAARAAHLAALRFDHFGNWYQPIDEVDSWEKYLAARPGPLREAIRRKSARLFKDPATKVSIVTSAHELKRGIAAYQEIYASSWKPPEPFADFNPAFMRLAASAGSLRLALLSVESRPIAAQLWTLDHGVATLMKLAHRREADALSPGTVLTAWMIRHMLETERADEIDFGRGDDAYKSNWISSRRQRTGVILANPATLSGLATLFRHKLGRLRARRANK